MKCLRFKQLILIYIIYMIFFSSTYAFAFEDINLDKFIPQNLQGIMDNGNLKMKSILNDEGEYEIHLTMDTLGLDKGYYTAFIFENISQSWDDYNGVLFHIENMGENQVNLNFNIIKNNGTNLKVDDDKFILLKRDNSDIIEQLKLLYGSVPIEKGFTGNICIPFSSLNGSIDDKDSLSSWGISITTEENESENIKFNNFAFVNKSSDLNKYIYNPVNIEGDIRVQIPVIGESVSKYNVSGDPDNIIFKLDDDYEGINIDKDGLLTISKNIEPKLIRIMAVNENNIGNTKQIELFKSWSIGMKYDDGVSMSIPCPREIKKIKDINDSPISKTVFTILRVFSIGLVGGGALLFLYWRKNYIL